MTNLRIHRHLAIIVSLLILCACGGGGATLSLLASVPVGLEPVAVAEDPNGYAWVVNHLSDSISVIDVNALPARVINTLWVGDEPRDIVFAGAERERAFITTARRGQNSPVDASDLPFGVQETTEQDCQRNHLFCYYTICSVLVA